MRTVINLTPHAINVGDICVAPSGKVARVSSKSEPVGSVSGIPLVRASFGAVDGLPEPEEGVLLIVSAVVRAACPNRADLASPGDPVRDEGGRVIGCKNLIVNDGWA